MSLAPSFGNLKDAYCDIISLKMFVLLFFCLEVNVVMSLSSPGSECLIADKLYHKATQRCYPPLEQGPCKTGEWFVLQDSLSGTSAMNFFKCISVLR